MGQIDFNLRSVCRQVEVRSRLGSIQAVVRWLSDISQFTVRLMLVLGRLILCSGPFKRCIQINLTSGCHQPDINRPSAGIYLISA